MSPSAFDDLTEIYDRLIDWPKRLANEEPFYRRWFEEVGVRRVVDVACGTGHHAAMFHRWGLAVEGSDVSPNMIDRAKEHFGQPEGLRWRVRGFEDPIEPDRPFDAAVCIGNSLALAGELSIVDRALQNMLAAVRPGGAVIVHVLNLWRLAEGPTIWQKCKRLDLPGGGAVVLKGVHRCGSRGFVDLAVIPDQRPEQLRSESAEFLGLDPEQLTASARDGGAPEPQFFGDYGRGDYDRLGSVDLIMVARKRP
jgi:SAM-dependent methyltransferase